MTRKNRLFCLVIVCMALLVLTGVSSYATNLMPQASFENWTVGTTYTEEEAFKDNWRFFANSGTGGTITAVSDAHDGSVAIELSRTSTDGDMAFGLWNTTDHHLKLMDVEPGKRYIVRFWAKSDDSINMRFGLSSFGNSEGNDWIGDTVEVNPAITHPKWSVYQTTYVAPAGAYHCGINFAPKGVGSVIIDDLSMVEEDTVAGQNMFPDPSFASLSTDETFTGETKVGSFRFFAGTGLGSLTAVDPGYDGAGDTAVSFKCDVNAGSWAGSDMAIGLASQPTGPMNSNMPAIVGRTYRYTFYAKTAVGCTASESANLAEYVRSYCSAYKAYSTYIGNDNQWISDQNDGWEIPNDGVWHKCTKTYTPPANTLFVGFAFRQRRTGTLLIDNVSFTDVTPYTVSGTVTSSLNSNAISGATVTFTGDETYTTTTDSNGGYSISVARGSYDMTVAASGYATYSESDVVFTAATTKDVNLMSDSTQSWSVYDTFERVDSTDLGTTEDSNALPWVKNSNVSSSIDHYAMYFKTDGLVDTTYIGTCLGRGFAPTNFDATVSLDWIDQSVYGKWAGVSYRQDVLGSADDGYVVQLWMYSCDGNQGPLMNLWCNGARVTEDMPVSITSNDGNILRLSVHGTSHKIWLNDTLVIDVADSKKTTGGYMGLFCDKDNEVKWDDFSASYTYTPPTPVDTIADAKALADGTEVQVGETLVATVASASFSDGSYYIENADRAYGIKVLYGYAVSEGSQVSGLTGTIDTDSNGERYIKATDMTVTSGDAVSALGMTNKSAVESLAQGMLVKVWGNVTAVASDKSYFYVNDGSNVDDGTGNIGIRVDYSNSTVQRLSAIAVGESVAVTGVMGFGNDGTTAVKVIRPKSSLDVVNTIVNEVTVTSSDTSWICQFTEGYGSVAFAAAPDSQYGSGAVLMTAPAVGNEGVINLRTDLHAGLPLADITELSISDYMTYFYTADTYARGIGVRISVDLDGIADETTGSYVDDILTCDQWNDRLTGSYGYDRCALNKWVTFDAVNVGRWYSSSGYAGSSDAGPYISLATYLTYFPDAKIATYSIGGLRFFMGGAAPHWNNVTGYIDNVRVGTSSGTTVYNFE